MSFLLKSSDVREPSDLNTPLGSALIVLPDMSSVCRLPKPTRQSASSLTKLFPLRSNCWSDVRRENTRLFRSVILQSKDYLQKHHQLGIQSQLWHSPPNLGVRIYLPVGYFCWFMLRHTDQVLKEFLSKPVIQSPCTTGTSFDHNCFWGWIYYCHPPQMSFIIHVAAKTYRFEPSRSLVTPAGNLVSYKFLMLLEVISRSLSRALFESLGCVTKLAPAMYKTCRFARASNAPSSIPFKCSLCDRSSFIRRLLSPADGIIYDIIFYVIGLSMTNSTAELSVK